MDKSKTILLVVVVASLLCCCVVIPVGCLLTGGAAFLPAYIGVGTYQSVDLLLGAMRDENFPDAFRQLHPDFQDLLDGPQDLENLILDGEVVPQTWTISGVNVSSEGGEDAVATVTGTITYKGGASGEFEIQLKQSEGAWKVIYFDFR